MVNLSDPAFCKRSLYAATILFEGGNIGQVYRIWSQGSSLGHNLFSWVGVLLGLCLWYNYYRVIYPEDKLAKGCNVIGIVATSAIIASIIYFRYILKTG